ncbi:transketolase [Candidatus Woesearchaeota archaeon]|nr:transketolase [Candidatus Woesearchaeota archaeon]
MADATTVAKLKEKAKQLRIESVKLVYQAGSGHPGGSLSAADIMAALFYHHMKYDPKRPDWPSRDRFILSKGHCTPLLYSVFADVGYFPKEELATYRRLGRLTGHPNPKLPGVEIATGSLGQGLSVGHGMALAGKLDKKDFYVYVLLGDGELNEGQVWEAAMSAAQYKSDHLIALVDNNKVAQDNLTANLKNIEPVDKKFEAFGWQTFRINGHDIAAIIDALAAAKKIRGKPVIIVADTIKGKGVSYMEGKPDWHGKAPNEELFRKAMEELEKGG